MAHAEPTAVGTTAQPPRTNKHKSAAQAFVFGEPRRKHLPSQSDGGSGQSSLAHRPGAGGAGRAASPRLQRSHTNSSSSNSANQQQQQQQQPQKTAHEASRNRLPHVGNPFRYEGGRRYLRDPTLDYPLPVDLPELHRQSMRLLMLMRLFGAPFCNSTFDSDAPPTKVLEIGCGTALWTTACHDYFKEHGHNNISFTGLDIAPLAPNLKATGINWHFVQHDLRKQPLPFADGEFDFVFIKDLGLCIGHAGSVEAPMMETIRILKPGGVLELWESDHVFRALLPNPGVPPTSTEDEQEQAEACAAYLMSPYTAFAPSQNKYLVDHNSWLESALTKRGLVAAPCGMVAWAIGSHVDTLKDSGSCRIALPFSETRWEQQAKKHLTPYQASLRQTALETSVQFIESIEPLLKEESGKRQDEWDGWKAGMMKDLLEGGGTSNGECLELGAWWATRY